MSKQGNRARQLIAIGFLGLIFVSSQVSAALSAKEFFTTPDFSSVSMSPDGKRVAAVRHKNGESFLVVSGVTSGSEEWRLSAAELSRKKTSIDGWMWIDRDRLVIQSTSERRGIEALLDTKKKSEWYVWDLPSSQPERAKLKRIMTPGWVVDPQPLREGEFLYAKSGAYSKVYRIRVDQLSAPGTLSKLMAVDGGQFTASNEVRSVVGYAVRWFLDSDSEVRAALHFDSKGALTLSAFDEAGEAQTLEQWEEEVSEAESEKIVPIALAPGEKQFYGLDFKEEAERSIYLLDYTSGEKQLVHEISSYKIVDLILSPKDGTLIGVRTIKNGSRVDEYFEPTEPSRGWQATAGIQLELGSSPDGRRRLLYRESYNQPGTFSIQQSSGTSHLLGARFPTLHGKLSGSQVSKTLSVGELEIPYLLNLPQKAGGSSPLVVLPHGGPFSVYDDPGYDPLTQFLVASGYAVLRVNFRGSGGYSSKLKEAGKKQWGDLILEDIYRVTEKVVQRKDIDAARVCAMGISYGGYASTMMTIRHADLFRCAVTIAGVTDVNLMLNSSRMSSGQRKWAWEYIGDPRDDYDLLKSISPAYLAGELDVPIFIAHGGKDEVVDPEHAFRLKAALEVESKPFEWYFDPEVGHSLGEPKSRTQVFERSRQFLDSVLM